VDLGLVDALNEGVHSTVDAEHQKIAHNQGGQADESSEGLVDESRRKDLPHHQVTAMNGASHHGTENLKCIN